MAINSQIEKPEVQKETGRKEHQSHPRLIVFLVCLVISTLMWLFIELMKDYSDEISYSITFANAPKDLILTNSSDSILKIGMNAQGFELLAAKYARQEHNLVIDLSTLKIRPTAEGYMAFLPSANIVSQLGSQIHFKTNISSIKPDTLFFRFSEIFRKQVPVRMDVNYSLKRQFDVTDSLVCKPQFITVSSIKSIIDTISFVKTQQISLNQLDSSFNSKVALYKGKHANLLKYSTDSVTLRIGIEQVTEAGYNVPVSVLGNSELVKIFPDRVEIICRVPLSAYPTIDASDFATEVVYEPSLIKEKKLQVNLVKKPDKVRVLKISPPEVEFIIISK
jgi:hypothetical protein